METSTGNKWSKIEDLDELEEILSSKKHHKILIIHGKYPETSLLEAICNALPVKNKTTSDFYVVDFIGLSEAENSSEIIIQLESVVSKGESSVIHLVCIPDFEADKESRIILYPQCLVALGRVARMHQDSGVKMCVIHESSVSYFKLVCKPIKADMTEFVQIFCLRQDNEVAIPGRSVQSLLQDSPDNIVHANTKKFISARDKEINKIGLTISALFSISDRSYRDEVLSLVGVPRSIVSNNETPTAQVID